MAGEATFAAFYFLFNVLFAFVNVVMQDVTVRSSMKHAVVDRYTTMPFTYKPARNFNDINLPDEMYSWLSAAFVPVTFFETTENGAARGFCIPGAQCDVDEGGCQSNSDCLTGLTCSDRSTLLDGVIVNGNYWDSTELTEWCNWQGASVNLTRDAGITHPTAIPKTQACTTTPTLAGSQPACCWDYLTDAYITEIFSASSSLVEEVSSPILGRQNCPSSISVNGDCCATATSEPRDANLTASMDSRKVHNSRAVTVGNYNRLLMVRFTVKRFKLQTDSVGVNSAFRSLIPKTLSYHNALSANEDNLEHENKSSFPSQHSMEPKSYDWNEPESYGQAGGYVEWIVPADGPAEMGRILERMRMDGLFNTQLGTFTVDMMFYNGNTNTFMHVDFSFAFDPAGTCIMSSKTMFVDIAPSGLKQIAKYIEYFFLIPAAIFFVFYEFKQAFQRGLAIHMAMVNSWIDGLSLSLCCFVLLMNWIIMLDPTAQDFMFLTDDPNGFTDRKSFLDLIELQALTSMQVYFVAVNLLMIFFRSLAQITELEPNLGLIFRTLGVCSVNILYFCINFMLLLLGFVAFAYFTFGTHPHASKMDSPLRAFYRVFAMLMGQADYEGLEKAEPTIAIVFFFLFYMGVLFVQINMFVSILLSGYDICVFEMDKKKRENGGKSEKTLMQVIWDDFKQVLLGNVFAKAFGAIGAIWTMCMKPVLTGIFSCFAGLAKSATCGLSCPHPKKLCAMCCKSHGVNHPDDHTGQMKRELKRFKKLERTSKIRVKEFMKQEPARAEGLSKLAQSVKKVVIDAKAQKRQAVEDGSNYSVSAGEFENLWNMNNALEAEIESFTATASIHEKLCMLMFLTLFVTMLLLMSRGEDTYWATQATIDPAIGSTWVDFQPLRLTSYSEITSMEEAGFWAEHVLVDTLYGDLACKVAQGNVTPDIADCDSSSDDMQLVQLLNDWNLGFLNTTFVRVTIQPACYIDNDAEKFVGGTNYIRSLAQAGDCAGQNCFAAAIEAEGTCKSIAGHVFDQDSYYIQGFLGHNEHELQNYSYVKPSFLGPSGMTGGYAVSLGTTKASAKNMMETLLAEQWFTKNSASISFDWITYNGNLDMFTYNVIYFSLLQTGTVDIKRKTRNFPLNIDKGGGPFETNRGLVMVMFYMYLVLVIYFIALQFKELFIEFQRARAKKLPHCSFFAVYYRSLWNRTDTLSLVITCVSILIFIQFWMDTFRSEYMFALEFETKYSMPPKDVKLYKVPPQTDPGRGVQDDWYVFSQMEKIAEIYDAYLNLAAVNAFFIAIKVVKYANHVGKFRIYAYTLAEGSTRMAYFSLVIGTLLIGWSLFFLVLFGTDESSLAGLADALTTCFFWMLGDFDLENMLKAKENSAIISFIFFEVIIVFICLNMFLATMLNTYSMTIGKLEVELEKEKVAARHSDSFIEVLYADREAMKSDIAIVKDDFGDVWVLSAYQGGQAHLLGVYGGGEPTRTGEGEQAEIQMKGAQVIKVNGDREHWKAGFHSGSEIIENLPEGAGDIVVTFKAPANVDNTGMLGKLRSCLSGGGGAGGSSENKALSVKSFWRQHAAITQMARDIDTQERMIVEELSAAADGGGDSDEDDEGKGGNRGESDAHKSVRAKVKKKLDMLLFSRASPDAPEGADAFDVSLLDEKPQDGETNVSIQGQPGLDEARIEEQLTKTFKVGGHEVWLDCLITSMEAEMDVYQESVITEVLRTADLSDGKGGMWGKQEPPYMKEPLYRFYLLINSVLKILECKSRRKWHEWLEDESKARLEVYRQQNDILHEYVCELEFEFSTIMQKIQAFKGKKDTMIMQLSGLLDKQAYKNLDSSPLVAEDLNHMGRPPHMARLSIPWPDAVTQGK